MQSKTSFFNKTVFKKNLTRFAPVWGVYTLGLVLGIFILYGNGGMLKQWHFANNMLDMPNVMAYVNLVYAPVVVQLLFGDLYNSRMCNMLHAFPLRRESWFLTNVLSGLVFSLVPTAVMSLVSLPLLMDSLFEGAWTMAWWLFLASNLEYVCFFGLALFAAMVVGNRFTMAAGYGLLNAGAYVAFWLVDTVYTPMLYGVQTPRQLCNNLTPIDHMLVRFLNTDSWLYQLREEFGEKLTGASVTFTVTDQWWRLWMLAGVGIVFAVLALVLYRKRDLECAGDAVAFRCLVPVFQVLCAIFVATAGQFFLYAFLGLTQNFLVLGAGLVVGWFIGKMLVERSTRVFYLHNWYGLAALAAVFAVSLWLTHVDVLGIEHRLPDAEKVERVHFETDYTSGGWFEDQEDIEQLIRLQECAVDNRAEEGSGTYVFGTNGQWVRYIDDNADLIDEENENNRYTYVAEVGLRYEMKSGKVIRRRYNVWVDSEEGIIANTYLNRWESLQPGTVEIDGQQQDTMELLLDDLRYFNVNRVDDEKLLKEVCTRENMESLIAAVKADCEAGTIAQHPLFHTGHFRYESSRSETGYRETGNIYLDMSSEEYGWSVNVYPDSYNTLNWLRSHGLLNVEVRKENISQW